MAREGQGYSVRSEGLVNMDMQLNKKTNQTHLWSAKPRETIPIFFSFNKNLDSSNAILKFTGDKENKTIRKSFFRLRKCSEVERQCLQAAASDELNGVCCTKRQREVCCIYRKNSRRSRESSNRPRLDKKTGGKPDGREK